MTTYVKRDRCPIFAERLKELKGSLSNKQLGNLLGLSAATIGYYVTGERLPDIEIAAKIALHFGVSADWLLGLSDYKRKALEQTTAEELHLSEDVASLLLKDCGGLSRDLNCLLLNREFRKLIENIQMYAAAVKAEEIVDDIREECEEQDDYDLEEMEPVIISEIETAQHANSGRLASCLEALKERYSKYEDNSVFNRSSLGEVFIQGLHLHEFYELAANKTLVRLLDELSAETTQELQGD